MESKFKIILSSIIILSIAIATSFALTDYMVKNAKLEVTSNMNKTLLGEIQNTNQKINILEESIEKNVKDLKEEVEKINNQISKEDSKSLRDLFEAKSKEMQSVFSTLNEQVQYLTREIESNKKSDTVKTPDKDVNKESNGGSEKSANKDSNEDLGNNKSGKSTGFLSFFGF